MSSVCSASNATFCLPFDSSGTQQVLADLCVRFSALRAENRTQLKVKYRSAEGSTRQLRKSYIGTSLASHHDSRISPVLGYADISDNQLMLVTGPRVSYNDKVSTTDSHSSSAFQATLKRE